MRPINYAAALIMIGATFATPAAGQEDCLASYVVNSSKSITYLPIGSNADDRIGTTMSCSVADAMREKLFSTGQTIDPNLLGSTNQLRSKISEIRMRLDAGKSELETATTPPARLSAILGLEDIVLAAGLASATVGCVVSAQACKPAVAASVGLYELAKSASNGDLSQASAKARTDINVLHSMLQSIQAQLNDNIGQQSKRRFGAVLSEMCKAIREQCM